MNKFEYINHPADLKIHSWGNSMEESFANAILATVAYMAHPIEKAHPQKQIKQPLVFEEKTHEDLLFSVIDAVISTTVFDFFVTLSVEDICLKEKAGSLSLEITLVGEQFNKERHKEGIEIKAMTYSDIFVSKEKPFDCCFILDI